MSHPDPHDHGPSLVVAHREIGTVSMCTCGVVRLTIRYMSLRFEAPAFKELQELLIAAQARMDREAQASLPRRPTATDPLH